MNYEKQIEALCGPFLKEHGLTVRQEFPRGYPEFAEYSLLVFRDREARELLASIEIMDAEPALRDGFLQTYDASYGELADGSQFEFISNHKAIAIDPDADLAPQLVQFLQENLERKRRYLAGDVHRSTAFYQACLGIEEISDELGLSARVFKKGNVRSQLTFTTEDGRTGDLYVSAGKLRVEFDNQSSIIDCESDASIREAVKSNIYDALGRHKNTLGK